MKKLIFQDMIVKCARFSWHGFMLILILIFCGPGIAQTGISTSPNDQGSKAPSTWEQRFTFKGQVRPGPYERDPNIWVYSESFAKRFGMPKEWIDPSLKGAEAAAWRKFKTGISSCGWGGKETACKEETTCALNVYIDAQTNPLPWAQWSKDAETFDVYDSRRFLAPQLGERRGKKSDSPIAGRTHNIDRQPFADPETGAEAFYFDKPYLPEDWQGNAYRVSAYEKSAYANIAWLTFTNFNCGLGLTNPPQRRIFRIETRSIPLGATLKRLHEFVLPEGFDARIKEQLRKEREAELQFYKRSLDMK